MRDQVPGNRHRVQRFDGMKTNVSQDGIRCRDEHKEILAEQLGPETKSLREVAHN
jgi:hypothetical protein